MKGLIVVFSYFFLFFLYILGFSPQAFASSDTGDAVHIDPIGSVLLGLMIIFVSAKAGAYIAQRLKQPVVLGELCAGVLIGNLSLLHIGTFDSLITDPIYGIMSSLGVILLLFEVGLESSLSDLLKVGGLAFIVACIGIVVPSVLGFGVSSFLVPESSFYTHLFIGTTLCATSVGITARVLKDLNKTQSKEAKIILGAAVIDDVLGLILLAIVSGIISSVGEGTSSGISFSNILMISGKAIGFLVVSLFVGAKFAPKFFKSISRLNMEGSLLGFSLVFCFFLSYLANLVGLAPIVGAFAAGLIIDGKQFSKYFGEDHAPLEDLIHPLSKFFVPIFFVNMGMQVRLETFKDPTVCFLGICLALAGIIGKLACSLGVWKEKSINRLAIGVGMIPRGEVGLIFAMIGTKLMLNGEPAVSSRVYASIIVMVILTTLVTPPALKIILERKNR